MPKTTKDKQPHEGHIQGKAVEVGHYSKTLNYQHKGLKVMGQDVPDTLTELVRYTAQTTIRSRRNPTARSL